MSTSADIGVSECEGDGVRRDNLHVDSILREGSSAQEVAESSDGAASVDKPLAAITTRFVDWLMIKF